jgi:hypothetical protein
MSGQRACTVPRPAARHPPPQGRRATPGTSHYPGYPRFPPGSCQAYPGSGRVVLFLPRTVCPAPVKMGKQWPLATSRGRAHSPSEPRVLGWMAPTCGRALGPPGPLCGPVGLSRGVGRSRLKTSVSATASCRGLQRPRTSPKHTIVKHMMLASDAHREKAMRSAQSEASLVSIASPECGSAACAER